MPHLRPRKPAPKQLPKPTTECCVCGEQIGYGTPDGYQHLNDHVAAGEARRYLELDRYNKFKPVGWNYQRIGPFKPKSDCKNHYSASASSRVTDEALASLALEAKVWRVLQRQQGLEHLRHCSQCAGKAFRQQFPAQ